MFQRCVETTSEFCFSLLNYLFDRHNRLHAWSLYHPLYLGIQILLKKQIISPALPKKIKNRSSVTGNSLPYILFTWITLPETNSSPLKMHGWKMKICFRGGVAYLQVRTVSFRDGELQISKGTRVPKGFQSSLPPRHPSGWETGMTIRWRWHVGFAVQGLETSRRLSCFFNGNGYQGVPSPKKVVNNPHPYPFILLGCPAGT